MQKVLNDAPSTQLIVNSQNQQPVVYQFSTSQHRGGKTSLRLLDKTQKTNLN